MKFLAVVTPPPSIYQYNCLRGNGITAESATEVEFGNGCGGTGVVQWIRWQVHINDGDGGREG